MSLDKLLNPWGESQKALIANNKADALFSGATWEQIDTDSELRDFLRTALATSYPSAKDPQTDIKALVVIEAERIRGGWPWIWHGIPAAYPTTLSQHQYFNLIERLYLSKEYKSGKAAIFVHDMPTKSEIQTQKTRIQGVVTVVAVGIGAMAWVVGRRIKANKVGGID